MQHKYDNKNKGSLSCLTAIYRKFLFLLGIHTFSRHWILAIVILLVPCVQNNAFAGEGNPSENSGLFLSRPLQMQDSKTKRFNIKVQPAIYWVTGGIEFEYVTSAKFSVALFGAYKLSGVDYPVKKGYQGQDYMNDGYMAELLARYYITLNKRNIGLAPLGFYVQGFVNYSHLLYADGSVRPFSLNTRTRPSNSEGNQEDNFTFPNPMGGGIGAGYQVELLKNKVIANLTLGAQANSDNRGIFFTFFASPSIGMMF